MKYVDSRWIVHSRLRGARTADSTCLDAKYWLIRQSGCQVMAYSTVWMPLMVSTAFICPVELTDV